ncbi:glycosyl transferase family 1 [Roseibium hamelinense]|uniref:Glycosyl transferase family 1 n=1 Tax=Roseibium hamelinense TaxID=150831 RepID=A0A562SYE8_9HYPH|nr:glycosyltransferase family 4 protein [Roseibium hamelinense]MTI44790.1 glycosyltransferase family 1 protein [Roseibium hamelinense]TWI86018.1 glycosyl transferase family 1 [Roseibium hamelinense]
MTGVNVIGMPCGLHGLGQELRDKVKALTSVGVEVCIISKNYSSLKSTISDPVIDKLIQSEPKYPINLICQNLPATRLIKDQFPELLEGKYNIGAPYWEFEDLPETQQIGLDILDEVWVSNSFLNNIFRNHTDKPVIQMPLHIEPGAHSGNSRSAEKPFTFGYFFDCNSLIQRKDPKALILAFLEAFANKPNAHVNLTLKYKYEPAHYVRQDEVDEFLELASKDPRITMINEALGAEEMDQLIRSFDVFVSPHRCEGLGRGIIEAMMRGIPVAATDYSGPREFIAGGHARPLPFFKTHVGNAAIGDIRPNYIWSEVKIAPLVEELENLAGDPAGTRQLGEKAREKLAALSNGKLHGKACQKRLEHIEGTLI